MPGITARKSLLVGSTCVYAKACISDSADSARRITVSLPISRHAGDHRREHAGRRAGGRRDRQAAFVLSGRRSAPRSPCIAGGRFSTASLISPAKSSCRTAVTVIAAVSP